MKAGSRIAIHSTILPSTCVALAEEAAGRVIAVIDAPVSGGGHMAAVGKATVMVGGDTDAVAAAWPIFETFGELILHFGGIGAGQTAKLVNNALMASHMAIAHHGLAAGAALGLDRTALVELVKASSGRSYGFEVYARLPALGVFGHGANLLAKDVRLLGEALDGDSSFAAFHNLTVPFLALLQQAAAEAASGAKS
jgi:3-hydroxyisobutyrate dehydrogenase-like beta-hydroxyacid dehydrogenase